ncbi:MAG TPA: hypothetical protein VG406_20705 [Isosphaeraceae bacterium]|jgi:hypothetical protein|nr:hypothetical protein [Isosphaeraceae bacterium]
MSNDAPAHGQRRGRSARYPGVPLADCIRFCETIDARGLDGLSAAALASGLGYSNIKTNAFSARLSSARQFGLLASEGDSHTLTPLARSLLHPVSADDLPRLRRRSLLEPPLYAELAARLAGKRVPETPGLANLLYHHHHITATAKESAAAAFLESARFAGALGDDGILRPDPTEPEVEIEAPAPSIPKAKPLPGAKRPGVRLDLHLWGPDAGKVIRLRAPESITPASLDRFLQALRLLVRVEEPESL